ncbi:MAG: DinB family protein [Bacteroidota bacterium]
MKRIRFVHHLLGIGLFSAVGCKMDTAKVQANSSLEEADSDQNKETPKRLRKELIQAWQRSEKMTMANIEQMPAEYFTFKYTNEAMSFSEQWRHCIIYTCGQLAGRAEIKNPYENIKLPVQMPKAVIIQELKNMYRHVCQSVIELSDEKLLSNCNFAGETMPVWRLFYAMENHIIHHRGQCVVYLRLKGVVPKGYYGW